MKRNISLFLMLVFLITIGAGCQVFKGQVDQYTKDKMQPIELTYWRVFDDSEVFNETIQEYQSMHPNIKINYRKLRYDEYEKALIEAFAVDKGPDIFSIHNTWSRKYQSKGLISAMPNTITMIYPVVKQGLKDEIEYQKISTRHSPELIARDYVDVVYGDAVIPVYNEETSKYVNGIYGLPFSVDTLSLFYNKDLFNNAGIANPPQYWNDEFLQDVMNLTKQSSKGEILQAGVALGGGKNIERATDIMSVLMMQNGTVMMNGDQVSFHTVPYGQKKTTAPGVEALRFYTDFANPAKKVYCWNNTLDNSLNMFVAGKLAMLFGYSYMLPTIKASAPKLNFSVGSLPQIEGNATKVNFANYWLETVSSKSKHQEEAWDFVRFITSEERARKYLEKTQKPAALRTLVAEQQENPDLEVFADQVLTAQSWYKGEDAGAAENVMVEMVDEAVVSQNEEDFSKIISTAVKKIQQTIKLQQE